MYVILVYDILEIEGNQKVWRRTYKTCKKYLQHVQKSVFEGQLTKSQYMKLKNELTSILRKEYDSCIVYQFRNSLPDKKEFWGNEYDATDSFI